MQFAKVGTQAFITLILGAAVSFAVPILIAVIWKLRKKEHFTTILVGAATFFVFVTIEKMLQSLVLTVNNPVSGFLNANLVLWALVAGLFPGIFEETGRFLAFNTVLKKRKNRETSISYGIGHGGIEVILILGVAYIQYISYAVMINSGVFQTVVDQVAAAAPGQVDSLYTLADQLASLKVTDLGLGLVERVFAFLFHVGASILVFYACKDKKKVWLYPLAILLHTLLDFIASLYSVKVFTPSIPVLEAIFGAFGIMTFCAAYVFLYKKDISE